MKEEKLEQELKAFDFSLLHPVRESLRDKLLAMHRKDNAAPVGLLGRQWIAARMNDEELDWVAAAGGKGIGENPSQQSLDKFHRKD